MADNNSLGSLWFLTLFIILGLSVVIIEMWQPGTMDALVASVKAHLR